MATGDLTSGVKKRYGGLHSKIGGCSRRTLVPGKLMLEPLEELTMSRATTIISYIIIACASVSQAKDYYVAPNGNDCARGTSTQPFKTIQKAADLVQAGDVCHIVPGVYPETVTPKHSGTHARWA